MRGVEQSPMWEGGRREGGGRRDGGCVGSDVRAERREKRRRTDNQHIRVTKGGGDNGEGSMQDWQADAKVRGFGEGNEPADTSGARRGSEGERRRKTATM